MKTMQDEIINQLLYNIRTIGTLQKGNRLNCSKPFITVEEPYTGQWICRTREGDSRDKAITFITKEILIVVKYSELLRDNKFLDTDPNLKLTLEKIIKDLSLASTGLVNFCATYDDDPNINSKIDPLINLIRDHVLDVTSKVNDLNLVPFER